MPKRKSTTKQDIVRRICRETQLQKDDVKFIVQSFLDEIASELARGGRLEFRDFGIFKAMARRGREARNPKTGTKVNVPETVVARFVPGRNLKERLAQVDPEVLNDGKVVHEAAATAPNDEGSNA